MNENSCGHVADFRGAPTWCGDRPRKPVTCVLSEHDDRHVPHSDGKWDWRRVTRRQFTVQKA